MSSIAVSPEEVRFNGAKVVSTHAEYGRMATPDTEECIQNFRVMIVPLHQVE